ncbi:uncharacterized protein BO72DRAFT_446277 [Aspergillus fijiensis CBS 313.89]|uniref:Uncharacterized protein n=1 Tax=Aspergillus fijiensis CBS 313.89 TaxID=1448319 RepID=A0A8G1RUG5_9EURO|nr:uncharacterized protein BO72DRAFT_446277 [Aspergillus fijiensis CBS 313.89]RAK79464.1 hypothetical protein BO72DRAFT_446277 [Aspergillus fijiensis CBS 313.89]
MKGLIGMTSPVLSAIGGGAASFSRWVKRFYCPLLVLCSIFSSFQKLFVLRTYTVVILWSGL